MNTNETITFYAGGRYGQTHIEYVLSAEQYLDGAITDNDVIWWGANVTVADVIDRRAWIEARNIWLSAVFASNTTRQEREANALIIAQANKDMRDLEIHEDNQNS